MCLKKTLFDKQIALLLLENQQKKSVTNFLLYMWGEKCNSHRKKSLINAVFIININTDITQLLF